MNDGPRPTTATPEAEPDVATELAELDELERRLYSLGYGMTQISFAGETSDPPASAPGRAEALATLDEMAHGLLCSEETGRLLERLSSKATELDATHAAEVRVLSRDRRREANVPAKEAAALTRLTSEAEDVWRRAKRADDWASFEPYLDRLVEMRGRLAGYVDDSRDPYDVLLDEYEPGSSRELYDAFFEQTKACVVPLLADVRHAGKVSRACVEGTFDAERQLELGRDVVEAEGLDMDGLTIAETEHPFSDCTSSRHTFIATHVYPDDIMSNVFSMLHEGGHVLYMAGVDPAYDYTCLRDGTSSGMHEAQSRFFENVVGRSEAFAPVLLGLLRRRFPERFADVSPTELWLAANRVETSLVRTEADELTYPLHIIVRYEIEELLFSGEAKAADVPGLWADRMGSYLGVEVPNDSLGALQDTHWSCGDFGYFPTYALGGAYGAQLLDAMVGSGVDFEGALAAGDLAPIRGWLRENVWRFGRSKDPAQIISDACGAPFDASHYTRYLQRRFTRVYGL